MICKFLVMKIFQHTVYYIYVYIYSDTVKVDYVELVPVVTG